MKKAALLASFYFFFFVYVGVLVIYLPKVLMEHGHSAFEVGIIISAMPLVRFFAPFLFIKLLTITKRLYNQSLVILGISSFAYIFVLDSFYMLIMLHVLIGYAITVIIPYIEAYAIESFKEKYGKVRLFGSLGFIFTALFLADKLNSNESLFIFLILSILLTSFFGFLVVKNENASDITSDEPQESFRFSKNYSFWISALLLQVGFGGFYGFFTVYQEEHGLGLDAISYLWTFGVVCEVILFFYLAFFMKRFSLETIIKFSILITSFRWFLLFLFPGSFYIGLFTQAIHAFSFALYHASAISFLHTLYAQKKLAQQFFAGASYGLGSFVGSLVAGYFYGENLFLICALITLAGFFALKYGNNKFERER